MCGISGFFLLNNFSTHRESLQTLRNMTNVLRHRGPNASGYWSSEKDNIYLGHRRLSIIDLSLAISSKKVDKLEFKANAIH